MRISIPVESPTNADNLSQEEQRREGEKPFFSQSAVSIPKTTEYKRTKANTTKCFIQKRIFCLIKNNLSMLQILRLLVNILKTPSPCKRRNLLGHSGDRMEQRRNALEYILLLTFPSIPNPSQEFQHRRDQHELEGNHSTDRLHQQSGSNHTSSNKGPPRMNCSGSSK